MMHLVWVWTMRGPTPQKWDGDISTGPDGKSKLSGEDVLAHSPLSVLEEEMPLDHLAQVYALPAA